MPLPPSAVGDTTLPPCPSGERGAESRGDRSGNSCPSSASNVPSPSPRDFRPTRRPTGRLPMTSRLMLCVYGLALLSVVCLGVTAAAVRTPSRADAGKAMKNGNWKDAYETFQRLATDPADEPA